MGWKPIETAPKDGTKVDLWTSYGERFTDARWTHHMGWVIWGTDSFESPGWERVTPDPTHWMEIPEPPK